MYSKKRKKSILSKDLKFKDLIIRCSIFSIAYLFIGTLLCLILSLFAYRTKDPTSYFSICGIITPFLSALISGYIQSKINKQHYLIGGIILGVLIFSVTVILSLIITSENLSQNGILYKALIPFFSVIGSMLGIKKISNKTKHRR